MRIQQVQSELSPEHAPSSGRASPDVKPDGISVLQLNVEGITKPKITVIEHLLQTHKATIVLLQETHSEEPSKLKIPGYHLTAHTKSSVHGIATFVRYSAKWREVGTSAPESSLEWAATEVEGITIINVYKPPPFRLQPDSLPVFNGPCLYAGDFNCRSTTWGYSSTNPDGDALEDWASASGMRLLYDPKQPDSFHSGRWNTTSNPDLAFVNLDGPDPVRVILDHFPKSQHRPSLITAASPISCIPSKPVKRWNFRKADWTRFKDLVDQGVNSLPPASSCDLNHSYSSLCDLLIRAAKATIPRGFRKRYIPLWDVECSDHYNDFLRAEPGGEEAAINASALTACLDRKRRECWDETVQGIDFTHSSRQAWKTFNRLTGRSSKPTQCPVSANSIAKQLLDSGKFRNASKEHARHVKQETSALWQAPGVDGFLSTPFSIGELTFALRQLKSGKAQGPDNIPPEFLIHSGPRCLEWLRDFYSNCLMNLAIPKIWRKATVIATLKPNKPIDDPKNYRPISLLCVPFKLLERLLLARLEPVIDPLLPDEQAGFRRGRSTVHQIVNLTDDIEEAFEKGHKAGVVLVDLTAAYDTVWHHGLILKLLQTIPDRHLVRFLSTIISNRSFILKTSDGQVSRMRRLKNGAPQGSVLAPTLFNIYLSDLPSTSSSKYAYADDLALLYSHRSWSTVENVLSSDMDTLATYLRTWRLKLSTAKTTSTPFTLCTKEAHRQLSVKLNGSTLPCNPTPTYLGVKLDRQLTFKQHIESLRGKVSSRNNLLRRLAGSSWGAYTSTLRTGALTLVYSAAEYASPVWCRSAHAKKLDVTLNDTMRIVTGCLRRTPVSYLPVLSGIAPPALRREHHTLRLVKKAQQDDQHLLHARIPTQQNPGRQRLRSRRPFSRHAASLVDSDFNLKEKWNHEWQETAKPVQLTITPGIKIPPGAELPRKEWVTLNRLRCGVGRFAANMHRWGLKPSAACQCGAPEQTAHHIIFECPDLGPPGGTAVDLAHPSNETVAWIQTLSDVA